MIVSILLGTITSSRRLSRLGLAGARRAEEPCGGFRLTLPGAARAVARTRPRPPTLPLILLAIGVVLALLLGSLIAPFYLMATIAFTYFATLGLAVVVFVVVLGHSGVGQSVPFFLFVFLNALSVDYNLYLMSRIREEAREAPDPKMATTDHPAKYNSRGSDLGNPLRTLVPKVGLEPTRGVNPNGV